MPAFKKGIDYGSKGAGKGDGWGGDAKGAGSSVPVGPKPENMMRYLSLSPEDQEKISELKRLREIDEQERLAIVKDVIFNVALNGEREETRLTASVALANRIEGMPVARVMSASTDDVRAWMLQVQEDEAKREK